MAGTETGVDYLAEERKKTTFDVSEMTDLLNGGKQMTEKINFFSKLVSNDPVFRKDDRLHLSRSSIMKRALEKAFKMFYMAKKYNLSAEGISILRFLVDDISYADLHFYMFIPAIEGQASEEQKAKWLPLAKSCQIIGCYAQTEMGHGSNVQGLETVAKYDKTSGQFDINSPTLTSTKWWPGGLGKVSTHAVVYARLILDEKDYGIHAFFVQLRSLEDHKPLPGITVADIGTKFGNGGYNTMDNGLLRFNHVRIPREHLLMKYAQVTREGGYVRTKNAPRQLLYGAMVYIRQNIVIEAGLYLSRAVTIAIRYSAVRRQFASEEGRTENKVIDYRTQQCRLFFLLSTAYAFRFTGKWMKTLYSEVMEKLNAGNFSDLPEVHAATAGLKSLTTGITADGIEECRKLCGGHGYLCSSGLPELFAAYVPSCTYEGDNTVLMLQVARYLVKCFGQVNSGIAPVGTVQYLKNFQIFQNLKCSIQNGEGFLTPSFQMEAFSVVSVFQISNCAKKLFFASSLEKAFSENTIELVRMAKSHCRTIIVTKFIEGVASSSASEGVKSILKTLCDVFALSLIESNSGDFLEAKYLDTDQVDCIRDQRRMLLDKVRPNAVGLVDAFGYSDHFLGSALGRYDGNVYEHLYQTALRDPINDSQVVDGYEEYIRPLIQGDHLDLFQAKL